MEFASCVFYSSRCYGAEAVATAPGYFRLGDSFLAQSNVENALAFFDKVVDIWYKYLSALQANSETGAVPKDGGDRPSGGDSPEELGEDQLADGKDQLEQILDRRRKLLGDTHIASGEVMYTLGLFHFFLLSDGATAETLISTAMTTYEQQLGSSHQSSKHVANSLEYIRCQAGEAVSRHGLMSAGDFIGSNSLHTAQDKRA